MQEKFFIDYSDTTSQEKSAMISAAALVLFEGHEPEMVVRSCLAMINIIGVCPQTTDEDRQKIISLLDYLSGTLKEHKPEKV
jgi:hypothetical protein